VSPDIWLFHVVNDLTGRIVPLDITLGLIAEYGPLALVAGVLVQWFVPPKGRLIRRERILLAVVAGIIALAIASVVGFLLARPRPFVTFPRTYVLVASPHDPSFPSDHVTLSAALGSILAMQSLPWAIGSWGIVTAIAFARVFAGVHYPSDVLGGAVLGYVVARSFYRARQALRPFTGPVLDWIGSLPVIGK
jgi:undecaprenyl-diphosphatase